MVVPFTQFPFLQTFSFHSLRAIPFVFRVIVFDKGSTAIYDDHIRTYSFFFAPSRLVVQFMVIARVVLKCWA